MSKTLAGVIAIDPDWNALPNNIPPVLPAFLRGCLAKDPRARVRDIGDVRLAMAGVFDSQPTRVREDAPRSWRRTALPGLGAVAVGVLLWGVVLPMLQPGASPVVTRFVVTAMPSEPVAVTTNAVDLAISPDGSTIVYRSGEPPQLYVRDMDALAGRLLGGTEGARQPFFSPDGAWIGFELDGALTRVSVDGGTPFTLCMLDSPLMGATWGDDGRIVFAGSAIPGGLFHVDADGGEPRVLTAREANTDRWPRHLPGGRQLLFTRGTGVGVRQKEVAVFDLDTGAETLLGIIGSGAHYMTTGHLVYGTNGTLWAVPFDPERLEVLGAPVPLVERGLTRDGRGTVNFSLAQNGSLVYITGVGEDASRRTLAWVDRQGTVVALPAEPRGYVYPRISPDGTRVAVDVRDADDSDIWVWNLGEDTLTRLTLAQDGDTYPVWTPIVNVSSSRRNVRTAGC